MTASDDFVDRLLGGGQITKAERRRRAPKIVPDAFGWFLIQQGKVTLQAFQTEKECRQWLADTHRIRSVTS